MANMVHVYFGDGAGKSTAAAGAALRAVGYGKRVVIVRFLKSRPSGEDGVLDSLAGVTVLKPQGAAKFLWQMDAEEKVALCSEQDGMLRLALSMRPDLLVLDEAADAYLADVLNKELLESCVRDPQSEIVITGHRLPSFLEKADYLTRFQCLAHPYQKGVSAREGIEY